MQRLGFILILIGLALSAYLTGRSAMLAGRSESVDVCSTVFGIGCDETLQSPLARQLGVSLAGWGIVYFATLLILLVLGLWIRPFLVAAVSATLLISLPAALLSLLLIGVMVSGLADPCPLCFVVHAINLALPPVLKRSSGQSLRALFERLGRAGLFLIGKERGNQVEQKWTFLGLTTAALAALVLYQAILIQESAWRSRANRPSLQIATLLEFETGQVFEIPVDDGSPHLGPVAGPVRLVIFMDFGCPGCRRFRDTLNQLRNKFSDDVTIVFKHFPLETGCNPSIVRDIHPGACKLAQAAEAAHQQGRFWPFHEYAFQSRRVMDDAQLQSLAVQARLDLVRFDQDRHSNAIRDRIAADVALGARLGVDSTPAVFLNGKRVPDLRYETLEFLVTVALQRAQTNSQAK